MFDVVNDFDGTAFKSRLSSRHKMGKTGTSQEKKISLEEREKEYLKMKKLIREIFGFYRICTI